MVESGVYKIQSISHPERCYIGSAKTIKRRWWDHKNELRKNTHHSPKLQNHVNKYGFDDLKFMVLMECSVVKLRVKEQCFLNIYQPYFNICKTVCNITNTGDLKRTKEHKENISIAQTGENNSFFGKHHSDESKRKKSEWNLAHGMKPPGYHKGRKKGSKNKPKTQPCQVSE